MIRGKSASSDKLYDVLADIQNCEYELTVIAHIAGLTFDDVNNLTIDDLKNGLDVNFKHAVKDKVPGVLSEYNILRKQHYLLISYARIIYRRLTVAKWLANHD